MNGIITLTVIVNIIIARRLARHEVKYANETWCVTNTVLIIYNTTIGEYEQSLMFTAFLYYALKGAYYARRTDV